jgi:integrase
MNCSTTSITPTDRPTWAIQKKANVWYLAWAVPRCIQHLPLFKGRRLYTKTLCTADLREAQRRRDCIVSTFSPLVAEAESDKQQRESQQFSAYLIQLRQAADGVAPTPAPRPAPTKSKPTPKPAPVTPAPATEGVTIEAAAAEFIEAENQKASKGMKPVADATLGRARNAATGLTEFTGKQALGDIERRDVTLWLASMAGRKSDSTRQNYVSALSLVWEYCYLLRKVNSVTGGNPFKGVNFKSTGDHQAYEAFTQTELSALAVASTPAIKMLMKFALVTGCRLGELVGLREGDFEMRQGVPVLCIRAGKTSNSIRDIPLPQPLWAELQSCVTSRLWFLRNGSTDAAQWSHKFGLLKAKVMGGRDRQKTFHSLRGMCITGYQRAGIPEDVTAPLMGHGIKGLTLSYGLYSSGHTLAHQLQAVEGMLASEYMQQHLGQLISPAGE